MKHILLEKSTTVVTILGGLCLILAALIWHEGARQSSLVQIMAENLGKDYVGGGWYPANGTDYDLEARIVGQEGWTTKAINVKRGDQVEVRLRIASGNGIARLSDSMAVIYRDTQLSDVTAEVTDGLMALAGTYDSSDVSHVAYAPVGVYDFKSNVWSGETGAYSLGVAYDGANGTIYRQILIVPPNSEIEFHVVLSFVAFGLACFFIFVPITIAVCHWYEKKCYAW